MYALLKRFHHEIGPLMDVVPVNKSGKKIKTIHDLQKCKALLDTGANTTCISKSLAEKLDLKTEYEMNAKTPLNSTLVKIYTLDLFLCFDNDEYHEIECDEVVEFNGNEYYDIIIGRDIITLGQLNMLPRNVFSFTL